RLTPSRPRPRASPWTRGAGPRAASTSPSSEAPDVQRHDAVAVGGHRRAVRHPARDHRHLPRTERRGLAVDDEVDSAALDHARDLVLGVLVGLPRAARLVAVDRRGQLLGVDRRAEDAGPDLTELQVLPAHQTAAGTCVATTRLRRMPTFSISHSTVSPG